MEYAEILQLLAELAVAVMGFSGIVAVLGRRSKGEWNRVDRIRFFSMVRLTISVLVLALLPFPFYFAGYTDETIWGLSSAIASLVVVLNLVAAGIDGAFTRPVLAAPGTSRIAIFFTFISAAAAVVFALNAVGIGLQRSFTPYLVAMLFLFGSPVVLFIRLLHTAIGPARST